MESTDIPKITTLNDLIRELYRAFESEHLDVEYVTNLLKAYKSNPKEWKKYAVFDPFRYTRNLVDKGNDKFNLMMLCWGESCGSSIHDHSNAQCFVKIMDGQLKESLYDWPENPEDETQPLRLRTANVYGRDEVTHINDSIGIHRMENPSHVDPCVSMHLYYPPFQSCKIFDERTGHQTESKVTFYTEFGKRTPFTVKH